jgi:site-specific DNA recombinase
MGTASGAGRRRAPRAHDVVEMESLGIPMVDCSTGTHSNTKMGRSITGLTAIVNDQFLQMVKTETHRGLEGRALAGFHTGGRCYGYSSVPEENPSDPENARAVVVFNANEAKIVRRIFEMYASGKSLDAIVTDLNTEGIPAPRTATWAKDQIHSMLRNERYIGKVIWNRREWYTDPKTEKRRYRERPASEWTTLEQPELRLVPADVWSKVQARHAANGRGSRRPARKGVVHPLSGVLLCGTCGSPMTIVGGKTIGDRRVYNYGCGTRQSRGASACSNKSTVSEARILEASLAALRSLLSSDDFESWVADEALEVRRELERATQRADERAAAEADVRAAQKRIDNLTEAICSVGVNDILAAKLRAEEKKLLDAKQRLATAVAPKKAPPVPPVVTATVMKLMDRLEVLAQHKPAEAREALAGIIESIVLTPGPDGYSAKLVLKNEAATLGGGRFVQHGCGGPMINFLSTAHEAVSVVIHGRIHRNAVCRGLRGVLLSA